MDEIWRLSSVDFKKSDDKFKQDWYNRARGPNMTLRAIELCANRAVFTDKAMAKYATGDLYENDYDKEYDHKAKRKIRRKRLISIEELCQPQLEGGVDDNYVDSWAAIDYDRDRARDMHYIPAYYTDAPDKTLNLKLYKKLREISEESAILRVIVAWYIYTNGYMDALTEAQAAFWETDFCLIDMLESDDRCKVKWLISYTNIDTQTFYRHRAYIQEHLSEFYKEFYSNT